MGLFGGSSKTNTSTLYDTNTVTTQTDQSGNSGINNSGSGSISLAVDSNDVYDSRDLSSRTSISDSGNTSDNRDQSVNDSGNVYSDFGAISAGRDLAESALSFASEAGSNASGLAAASTNRALDFGADALTTVQRVNADSIELLGSLVGQTIDATKTLAREGAQANSTTLSDALGGFKQLAIQNSESDADKMTKVIGYALAAVVAALVLPAIFKSGGRAVTI
jgi:hypothetical protein